MGTASKLSAQVSQWLRRPGVGAVLILIAGVVMPPPAPHGDSAHLLGLPTLCPLRAVTGIPCPGCGMSRAICLCCHGRFAEAFTVYSPVSPLIFAWLIATAAYGIVCRRPLPSRLLNPIIYVCIALLLAVWGARMLHFLPYPPL